MTASAFLTLTQAAEYLHYAHRSGAWKWLRDNDVRMFWRGKRLLIRQTDIDKALDKHATGDTVARAKKASGF